MEREITNDMIHKAQRYTNTYCKARTESAKKLLEFINANNGVTKDQIKANNLSMFGIDRLVKLSLVRAERISDPERGRGCHHFVYYPAETK
jgi:hypothetical protein